MYNLRKALEERIAKRGETLEAIVVGQHDRHRYDAPTNADENIILTPEAGLAKIDQDYDNGYGGADCYPFYAWTDKSIYFVGEYDGATGIDRVPRHPQACKPQFSGDSE